MSLRFILLLCHALVEPVERERLLKETKRLFVRARANSHCFSFFVKCLHNLGITDEI